MSRTVSTTGTSTGPTPRSQSDRSAPTASTTAPPGAAADIAETPAEEHLAACVNRVDCHSPYRWEGAVYDEPEVALLAKTTADRDGDLRERVRLLHPHDVPCIERFDGGGVLDAFADWLAETGEEASERLRGRPRQ